MPDFNLPDNLPTWILILVIVLNLFKEPISSLISERFPQMANSHFGSISKDKSDRREFEQQKELEVLRNDLASADAIRKAGELTTKQQIERERTYTAIIDNQFLFMQKLVDNNLIHLEVSLISEIKALRGSFERLSRMMRDSDDPIREKLLKKIEDE
jgi:hypothetical protein